MTSPQSTRLKPNTLWEKGESLDESLFRGYVHAAMHPLVQVVVDGRRYTDGPDNTVIPDERPHQEAQPDHQSDEGKNSPGWEEHVITVGVILKSRTFGIKMTVMFAVGLVLFAREKSRMHDKPMHAVFQKRICHYGHEERYRMQEEDRHHISRKVCYCLLFCGFWPIQNPATVYINTIF